MEMVAWLAGEPHSDEPACACPVIGAVVRCFNDAMPTDAARERWLRPLVPTVVNTRTDVRSEHARAWLVADRAARVLAPAILRRSDRHADAHALAIAPALRTRADALAVLQHLAHPEVKAARWVVQRAAEGELPPQLWVAGVVWAGREIGGAAGWNAVVDVVRAMVRINAVQPLRRVPQVSTS